VLHTGTNGFVTHADPRTAVVQTRKQTMEKTYNMMCTTPQPFYSPFRVFRDHPGELAPEENFWTLWCKERLTEADKPTIRFGAIQSRSISAHLYHPPFLQDGCPSYRPTSSVKVAAIYDVIHTKIWKN